MVIAVAVIVLVALMVWVVVVVVVVVLASVVLVAVGAAVVVHSVLLSGFQHIPVDAWRVEGVGVKGGFVALPLAC